MSLVHRFGSGESDEGMNEKTISVDGLKIRYLEEGSGPVVLLMHGGTLGFSANMWLKNIAPIAAGGYRVLSYDQPGYGHSDAPADFGMLYRQRFMAQFLAALGVKKATLVGHSQAGGLVVGAALETPQLFSGIVVLGTGSLLPPLPSAGGGPKADVEPPMTEPTVEDTLRSLETTLVDHSHITPDALAAYHALCIGKNFANAVKRADAVASQGRGSAKPLWQCLGDVTIPSFYIYGANDRGNPTERLKLARERFPHLSFQLLDRCHHIVQWDRGEDVDRMVLAFLAGLNVKGAVTA